MLSQSAASNDSKSNSLAQPRGVNSDSHSQSNGVHSGPNTAKNIANGLPSKTYACFEQYMYTALWSNA